MILTKGGKMVRLMLNGCVKSPYFLNVRGEVLRTTLISSQMTDFHTSAIRQAGEDWRKRNNQPANPNAYGVLTDGPDYFFLDGRSTPIGLGRLKRAKAQFESATKIMQLTKEIDIAVELHAQRQREEQERRADKIAGKLKPKGTVPPEVSSK